MRHPRPIDVVAWTCRSMVCGALVSLGLLVPRKLAGQGAAEVAAPPSAARLEQQATALRRAGHADVSMAAYRRALAHDPQWQEGWWYLGTLSYDANQFGAAVAAFRRLTELNPKLGPAWALLGLSEFELHDFKRALPDLNRGCDLGLHARPDLENVASYHLALLLNLEGDPDAARSVLDALVVRGVRSEDVQMALGLTLLRVPLLPSQVSPSKDALIHAAGHIGQLMALGEKERADSGFREFLTQFPGTPFAHYAYGAFLDSQGRGQEAIQQFKQELRITPDSAAPYLEWAHLEWHLGHPEKAMALAKNAVRLAPQSFVAHYLLGGTLLALGQTAASIPVLEEARRLAPYSPEVRYSLGQAYTKAGRTAEAKREQAAFLRLRARMQKLRVRHPQNGINLGFGVESAASPGPPS